MLRDHGVYGENKGTGEVYSPVIGAMGGWQEGETVGSWLGMGGWLWELTDHQVTASELSICPLVVSAHHSNWLTGPSVVQSLRLLYV